MKLVWSRILCFAESTVCLRVMSHLWKIPIVFTIANNIEEYSKFAFHNFLFDLSFFRFVLSVHDLVIWFMSLFHFSWDHLESIWKPLHWLMNFLSIVLPPLRVFRAAFHLLLDCANYAQKLFFNNTNCHFALYCSQWVFFQ